MTPDYEVTVLDRIEVAHDKTVQVRWATILMRDDADGVAKEIARTAYHRTSYVPGADLSGADSKVVATARAAWAPLGIDVPLSTPLPPQE